MNQKRTRGVVQTDPGAPMLARPALAVHIARIVSGWAVVENLHGHLMAYMLGSDAAIGMTIYLALRGDAAKEAAIVTVAKRSLSPAMLKRFRDLRTERDGLAKARNAIVHGVWETSAQYPDALLCSNPEEGTANLAATWAAFVKYRGQPDWVERVSTAAPADFERYTIYEEADFLAIIERIIDLIEDVQAFSRDLEDSENLADDA